MLTTSRQRAERERERKRKREIKDNSLMPSFFLCFQRALLKSVNSLSTTTDRRSLMPLSRINSTLDRYRMHRRSVMLVTDLDKKQVCLGCTKDN